MAKIYTKYRYDKVKKKLEPHAENLNLSPYQERLIKKVHFVNPSDCFDEGFRSTLILLGPNLPSGKIISKQISSIDIFPTILDLVKIPTNKKFSSLNLSHSVIIFCFELFRYF